MSTTSVQPDLSLNLALCKALQVVINRFLAYAPGSAEQLKSLSGQCLALRSSLPPLQLVCRFQDQGPELGVYSEQANVEIEGTLLNLFLLAQNNPSSFAQTGIRVSGDAKLLQKLRDILSQSDFDWRQPVFDALGDVLGQTAVAILEQTLVRAHQSSRKIPSYLAEYLSEEAQWLVSQNEFELWQQAVEDSRSDVERLQALLHKLKTEI